MAVVVVGDEACEVALTTRCATSPTSRSTTAILFVQIQSGGEMAVQNGSMPTTTKGQAIP